MILRYRNTEHGLIDFHKLIKTTDTLKLGFDNRVVTEIWVQSESLDHDHSTFLLTLISAQVCVILPFTETKFS